MISAWQRFTGLVADDRSLVAESLRMLIGVRVGLRAMPFTTLQRRLAQRPLAERPQSLERVAWAVKAVTRRVPGTKCLAEALVMHTMLRRYGHAPVFRIGVREGRSALEAHAWVECGGAVVIGAIDDLPDHAVLS